MQSFTAPCADGGQVGLTLHAAEDADRPVILIHPATAVRERLYWPFAEFLRLCGFNVVTYNYRGVGAGARDRANQHLTMRDWISQDVPAVTGWAGQRFPGARMLAIGHSLGGHAIGLCDNSKPLTAAALIASHAGALRLIRGRIERLRVDMVFRAVVPVIASASRRFPAKRLGVGEDLPSAAMRDWGNWIKMPRYFFDDPSMNAAAQFARVKAPLLCYGFDDDPWATTAAIDLLTSHFTSTTVLRRQIDPATYGPNAIGHMGFFKPHHRETLWAEVANWLQMQVKPA